MASYKKQKLVGQYVSPDAKTASSDKFSKADLRQRMRPKILPILWL